ncbi:MAG: coiled-coil domain-containing protein [Planctomycetota bacterium]|jgi:hypothetical protein
MARQGNSTTSMTARHNKPSIEDVKRSLQHVRSAARFVLSAQRIMSAASVILALSLFIGVVDYAVRLPMAIRVINLVVALAALAFVLRRWILPALRFRPSLTSLALRLERIEPSWKGTLTSGIELANQPFEQPITRSLADNVVRRATSVWHESRKPRIVRLDGVVRSGVVLACIGAVVLALAVLQSGMTRIAMTRTFLPWVDARWPARTDIESLMAQSVHPSDRAIPFRAALLRSNWDFASTDVYVRWRPEGTSESERVLLTWQRQAEPISIGALRVQGQVYERLHDPQHERIEFRFETHDDTTPWQTLTFIDPPAVRSASALIHPPPYITQSEHTTSELATRVNEMGDGTNERAIAPTALAGSSIELTLDLTKPALFDADDQQWIESTLGSEILALSPTIESEGTSSTRWTVSFVLANSVRIPVHLVDEHGIESNTDTTYRFPATEDGVPLVTLIDPDRDMEVLPDATIPVTGEGVDDVGLDSIWINLTHMVPEGETGPSGPGGALRPLHETPDRIAFVETGGERLKQITTELRFGELNVEPGHEIHVQAMATDTLGSWSPSTRPPSESRVRRFRVLSEEEFLERIQAGLSRARQSAITTDEQQARARQMIEQEPPDSMARRQQALVGDRLSSMIEQLDDIQESVERNQYEDDELTSLLEAARQTLERAGQQSGRASEAIDEILSQEEQGRDMSDSSQSAEAQEAQQNVQSELEQLAELLDRGEDTWVQRRRLQNLIEAQESLREQTEQIGQETTGRQEDELTGEQREELDRIADEQRALSEQTQETIESMQESLEQLRQNDTVAASGIEEALRTAQQQNTEEVQEQAAEQVEQNRTSRASSMQQQAAESLQQMLDAMDQALEERDEVLQRLLLNLIDAIESLIASQEAELQALRDNNIDGRDRAMIQLRTNTLGVREQASAGGVELAGVSSLLTRASDAQSRAVVALRANPANTEDAQKNESSSLELLREALEQAQQLEEEMEQRIQDRKREELREAYESALELQIAIHDQTHPLGQQDQISRRDRLTLRRLGDQQDELAGQLLDLRENIEDIAGAAIFEYTHDKLDARLASATTDLRDALPGEASVNQQRAIELLRGLVEATREDEQDDDEFRENAAGGGSGGSGGEQQEQVIPPIAELKLLKQLQQDVYTRTRHIGEAQDPPGEDEIREIGSTQNDLAELGEELIRKLEEQGNGGNN